MRRKGRPLHPEEHKLWGQVTRSVTPRHGPVHQPTEEELTHNRFPPLKPATPAKRAFGAPATKPQRPAGPPQSSLDGSTERKLKRGRAQIDAKLDLHGMRQAEAHDALVRFILNAQVHGHRCVLVITGKGTRGESQNNPYETPGPGILKSRLGQWLAQDPLRGIAYGLREAHPRHGGSGAHYVFIRKKKS